MKEKREGRQEERRKNGAREQRRESRQERKKEGWQKGRKEDRQEGRKEGKQFFEYMPRNGRAGSYGHSILNFVRNIYTRFHRVTPVYNLINAKYKC